jgi:glycosyltransferase involved in cell wall biosynthesis
MLSKMKLVVISHKVCFPLDNSPSGFATDGGFPRQIKAISELFGETKLVVPCENGKNPGGVSALEGHNLQVRPLSVPKGKGFFRKLRMPFWLLRNGWRIGREVARADAVHAPIPGDVGTIGMLFSLLLRKPLFVRHCGNWMAQRTAAEAFWKWSMERFAGGRNVMLATGGSNSVPSNRNANIKWIFSTSLTQNEIRQAAARDFPADGKLRLITVCRLEKRKGVDVVIESLPLILKKFPDVTLDVVGGGSLLDELKKRAKFLGLADKIRFHGKVEQEKVISLMKAADVFCYPTSASEGFPKVVLEALAGGLPVLTTKVSVLPKLIGTGCGILLEEATKEAVDAAIEKIYLDPNEYRRMSACAVSTAQQYSLENWRDVIGEILRDAWQVSSLSSTV